MAKEYARRGSAYAKAAGNLAWSGPALGSACSWLDFIEEFLTKIRLSPTPLTRILQFFSKLENDAKLPGHLIPHIAQHGESEFIFFLRAQRPLTK